MMKGPRAVLRIHGMKLALLGCLVACGGRADPPPPTTGSDRTTEIMERLDRLEKKLDVLAQTKVVAPIDAGVADAAVAVADAPPRPTPIVRRPAGSGGGNDLEPFPGSGSAKAADCSKWIANPSDPKCRVQYCKTHPNDVRCELLE